SSTRFSPACDSIVRSSKWSRVFWLHIDVPSPSAETARDTQRFACDPRGIGRSEKDRRRSNVLGLADAAQRCLCFNAFAEIALVEAGCAHSLRFHHAGIDGIDSNFARAEFLGQRSGDGIDRTL